MSYLDWTWNLNHSLYAKILKTGYFMFEYRFFCITGRIFGNRQLIWVIQTSKKQHVKDISFAKLGKWQVAEGTLYCFHAIHMTILFDLPSALIKYVFGNSLIKTSFEAKVIRSNWKLKTMFFSGSFDVQTMPSYHNK